LSCIQYTRPSGPTLSDSIRSPMKPEYGIRSSVGRPPSAGISRYQAAERMLPIAATRFAVAVRTNVSPTVVRTGDPFRMACIVT